MFLPGVRDDGSEAPPKRPRISTDAAHPPRASTCDLVGITALQYFGRLPADVACAVLIRLPVADACRAGMTCRADASLFTKRSPLWRAFYLRDYGSARHHRLAMAAMQDSAPAEMADVMTPRELIEYGAPGWRDLYHMRAPLSATAVNVMGEKRMEVQVGRPMRVIRGRFDARGQLCGYGLMVHHRSEAETNPVCVEGWWNDGHLHGPCIYINHDDIFTAGRAFGCREAVALSTRLGHFAPILFEGPTRVTSQHTSQLIVHERGMAIGMDLCAHTRTSSEQTTRLRVMSPGHWCGRTTVTKLRGTIVEYGASDSFIFIARGSIDQEGSTLTIRLDTGERFYRRTVNWCTGGRGVRCCLDSDALVYTDWDECEKTCGIIVVVEPRAHAPDDRVRYYYRGGQFVMLDEMPERSPFEPLHRLARAEGEARFGDYYCRPDSCAHNNVCLRSIVDPFYAWTGGWVAQAIDSPCGLGAFVQERNIPAGSLVFCPRARNDSATAAAAADTVDVAIGEVLHDFDACTRRLNAVMPPEAAGSDAASLVVLFADIVQRPRQYATAARAAAKRAYGRGFVERVYYGARELFADYVKAIRAYQNVCMRPVPTPCAYLRAYSDWLDKREPVSPSTAAG